jgi:hypothetical protein
VSNGRDSGLRGDVPGRREVSPPNPPPPRPAAAAEAGAETIAAAAPGWRWHLVAAVVLIAAVPVNMWGWVESDVIPFGEYAGYITAIEQLRDNLASYGRVPSWLPDQLGGISHFTSDFKEFVALPFLMAFGSITGYAIVLALARVLAAFALYAIIATLFRAPFAGLVAGYAYGFGAIAAHRSTFSGHLDILLSYILVPLAFVVALKTLHTKGRAWAALLGALVATQFSAHYLPGLVCALLVGLLWIGRPWCAASGADALEPLRDRWRALAPLAISVGVFALLAASQIGWLVLDTPNHALHAPQAVERAREHYSMQSPFVLVNRTGWLAPWLEQHRPDSLEVGPKGSLFAQRSYLGIVALVSIAVAAARLRRAPLHRKWFAFFGVAFFLQYWLAMGSHPLLWQLARSFHVSAATELWIARLLITAAALSAVAAGILALRRRGDPRARVGAKRLLWAAAFLAAVPLSLFDVAQALLPPLRAVRAPAHFFDLAPFAFYAWFGVSLAAIAHTLRRPLLRGACLVGVAVLVVVDFWPSRGTYLRGAPLPPLREFARTMTALEPGEPPARIGMVMHASLSNRTYSSLLARASGAGTAWSWVAWQAGPHWHPYYRHVYQGLVRPRSDAPTAEWGNVLARVGRIQYFLDEFIGKQRLSLPPPWRRIAANQRFALWQQPDVYPPAFGARDYLLTVGAASAEEVALGEVLMRAGGVVVSARDPSDSGFDALAAGASYLYVDPTLRAALAPRVSRKLVTPAELVERTRFTSRPLLEVAYQRPAPEHVALRFDAGAQPAIVFVSESHHPWWRARVDGEPAPVLRAIGAFMAVRVGPGVHRIDLEFRRPIGLRIAETLSRVAWLVVLAGLFVHAARWLRAQRRATGP